MADEYCAVADHDWLEEYYGYRCAICGLFYPYGSAPWEDPFYTESEDSEDEDEFTQ